jgi:hypothetical protein
VNVSIGRAATRNSGTEANSRVGKARASASHVPGGTVDLMATMLPSRAWAAISRTADHTSVRSKAPSSPTGEGTHRNSTEQAVRDSFEPTPR